MYTPNQDLLQDIVNMFTFRNEEVQVSKELENLIEEKTGLFNCSYYSDSYDDFQLIFNGELNIHKCLNNDTEIKETGNNELKHKYYNGKTNFQGQECLKSYSIDLDYNAKNHTINIVEYFGQVRNKKRTGTFDGFKIILIQLPEDLCH